MTLTHISVCVCTSRTDSARRAANTRQTWGAARTLTGWHGVSWVTRGVRRVWGVRWWRAVWRLITGRVRRHWVSVIIRRHAGDSGWQWRLVMRVYSDSLPLSVCLCVLKPASTCIRVTRVSRSVSSVYGAGCPCVGRYDYCWYFQNVTRAAIQSQQQYLDVDKG